MADKIYKNNKEAIESLIIKEFGDDVEFSWIDRDNGGTNKSGYDIKIGGKFYFISVVEPPEINGTHGLTPEEAIRKHEFFSKIRESVESFKVNDRVSENLESPKIKNSISANFPEYIPIHGKHVSMAKIIVENAGKPVEKAIYFCENYIANGTGIVRKEAADLTDNEASFVARAYAGLFKKADIFLKDEDSERLEIFGNNDPYDPKAILNNLSEILADDNKLKNIATGLEQNNFAKIKDCKSEEEKIVAAREYINNFREVVTKISDEYQKINGLDKGIVHGDPWFDNVIIINSDDIIKKEMDKAESSSSKLKIFSENPMGAIVIDIENSGYGFKAMDIATSIISVSGINPDGTLTDKAKNIVKGYDEVRIIDENFEKFSNLLIATAEANIGNMRLDKWANGNFSRRDPTKMMESCEKSLNDYLQGIRVSLTDVLTPPYKQIIQERPFVKERFSAKKEV